MTKTKSKKSTSQTPAYSKFELKRLISMLKSLLRNRNHAEFKHYMKILPYYEKILKQLEEEDGN